MACRAVGGGAVVSMAVYAVTHLQRPVLLDCDHRGDVAVTGRAHGGCWDPILCRKEPYVGLVDEVHVVRDPVHARPVDRQTCRGDFAQFLYLEVVIANRCVACHAQADGRDRGGGAVIHIAVTKCAV